MAPRRRRKPQAKAPVRPGDPKHQPGAPDGVRPRDRGGAKREADEPVLIRFDRKVLVFLGTLLLFLLLATAFKLHGSSIGMWNRSFPDRAPDAGVLLGKPKLIRIDEWAFMTPAMVSQAESRPSFSAANPSWGPSRTPLIMNLPVRHWSMAVRPQFWGFLVLDLERAFAFYWNMKAFLLLGGLFLLLMLLTGSDFGVSLLGTAWVFFSGFMQWWYSTPAMLPEMVGCVALVLVAMHYLVLSSSRWAIGASALVLSLCLLDSALSLYPPFQVPLLYLGIAILAGSLGPRLAAGHARGHLVFRAGSAVLALSAVAVFLGLYYRDAKHAIDLMLGTVYPGSRTSSGGEVALAQVFGGPYGFFMSEGHFPPKWLNVCEASNFVLLFPVPAAALLWWSRRGGRASTLEWSLIAYIVVVLSWMTIGWPHFLAVASAFGLSQGTRSLLGLGLASILLCCIFLAKSHVNLPRSFAPRVIVGASLLALFLVYSLIFNHATGTFATGNQIALVSLLGAAAGYLLLTRRRVAFAACILLPSMWTFGLVNPVGYGLGPIIETSFFKQVSPLIRRDPAARWAVYGPHTVADLLKAAGAQVFNGAKFVPPLEDLRVIDPKSSGASIYNRYAHIELEPDQGSAVSFSLYQGDWYIIHIAPSNDIWRRLGMRYVVLPYAATDPAFLATAGLVQTLPGAGLWIYRYTWSTEVTPATPRP